MAPESLDTESWKPTTRNLKLETAVELGNCRKISVTVLKMCRKLIELLG
jgi:hypothetical protein